MGVGVVSFGATVIEWAFDTETQDGKANLLAAAGPNGTSHLLFPDTFAQCYDWLRCRSRLWMAYNADYDARALIRFLPKTVWKRLYRDETTKYRDFTITFRPGRDFSVRRGNEKALHIYDVAAYFLTSLNKAAKKCGFELGKLDLPQTWYPEMTKHLLIDSHCKRIIEYAERDADVCLRLWLYLDSQFRKLGVPESALDRPLSPGNLAGAFWKEKLRFPKLDRKSNEVARRAFAGGRIEIYRRGTFKRAWILDIKSAYPAVMSRLPDPRDLEVVRRVKRPANALYSIERVRVSIPPGVKIPLLPAWSGNGKRIYPVGEWSGYWTGPEVDLARKMGWVIRHTDGIHLCGERKKWLTDIPRLYRERAKNPEVSMAIKLVLNSLYGKTAQQDDRVFRSAVITTRSRKIGGEYMSIWKRPAPSTNFFVAAYTTALTRIKLWKAMQAAGEENVILAATDGLLLSKKPPMKLGKRLGDWDGELTPVKAVVIGTGVYSLEYPGGTIIEKVRGFRTSESIRDLLNRSRTRIRCTSRYAYTLGDWAVKGDTCEMNVIADIPRVLDVNADDKRSWPRRWKAAREVLTGSMDSLPRILVERSAR